MAAVCDEVMLRDFVGLPEKKIPETCKNKDLITSIRTIIDELKQVTNLFIPR